MPTSSTSSQVGDQGLPAVLGVEEPGRVDVVAGGQRLEVTGDRIRDPDLVVDRDGADLGGRLPSTVTVELGLGAGRDGELADRSPSSAIDSNWSM